VKRFSRFHKFLFCNNMLPFVFNDYFTQNRTVHQYNTKQIIIILTEMLFFTGYKITKI